MIILLPKRNFLMQLIITTYQKLRNVCHIQLKMASAPFADRFKSVYVNIDLV